MRYLIGLTMMLIGIFSFSQKNSVYFPYFELINLLQDGELQYSTSRLYKTYIESNHEYSVILPAHDRIGYLAPLTTEEVLANAKEANAEYALTGEIHNLEGNFIIAVSVFEVKTGEKKYSDLIKGLTTEDLDPLLSRLGRTFMTKSKARDDVEIGEVSNYEQQGVELQQIKANNYFGVMVGANSLIGERTLSGFGGSYSFDASTVIFNVNFDYYFSSNGSQNDAFTSDRLELGSFNLGVTYPLSRKRMTWFLAGGMDYSFVELMSKGVDNTSTGGVGLFAGGGYLLSRNSSVNLKIHALAHFPSYQIEDNYYPSIRIGVTTSIAR